MIEPQVGLPDIVFTANDGAFYGNKAIASEFLKAGGSAKCPTLEVTESAGWDRTRFESRIRCPGPLESRYGMYDQAYSDLCTGRFEHL